MRKPEDLTREQLEQIADHVQLWLYEQNGDYVLDKDVNGGDFVEGMGSLLSDLGMAPPDAEERAAAVKVDRLATFVDGLMFTPEEQERRNREILDDLANGIAKPWLDVGLRLRHQSSNTNCPLNRGGGDGNSTCGCTCSDIDEFVISGPVPSVERGRS